MEKSSFFDAEIVNGEYDRVYLSEDYARYFSSFIGNGIFSNPSDNLSVVANGDNMKVIVKAGKAWINGYYYENDNDLVLNLDPADGVLNRIDRVVLRLDLIEREISVKIKQGVFASNPVSQELERNVDVYELVLADIKIQNGAISIVNSNINDLRLNTDLCGIVHGVVEQVDTREIFNTYQQYLNEKLNSNEFNEWFISLKNKLNPYEDLALQLQLQVDELDSKIFNIEESFGENLKEQLKSKADKDGTLQTNLNADMLDGKHTSDFILNGQEQTGFKNINVTKINDKTISGTLATNEKTNLITAMNEVFTNVSNANNSMTFNQLTTAINNINTGPKAGQGDPLQACTYYKSGTGTALINGIVDIDGTQFYTYATSTSNLVINKYDINTMTLTATGLTLTEKGLGAGNMTADGRFIVHGSAIYNRTFDTVLKKYDSTYFVFLDHTKTKIYAVRQTGSEGYVFLYQLTPTSDTTFTQTLLYQSRIPYLYSTYIPNGIVENKYYYYIQKKYVDSTHYLYRIDLQAQTVTEVTQFGSYLDNPKINYMDGDYYLSFYMGSGSENYHLYSIDKTTGGIKSIGYSGAIEKTTMLSYMANTAIYTDNPYLISAHASFSSTANGYRYFYYNKATNDVCTAWMRSNKTQYPVIVTKKYVVIACGTTTRIYKR